MRNLRYKFNFSNVILYVIIVALLALTARILQKPGEEKDNTKIVAVKTEPPVVTKVVSVKPTTAPSDDDPMSFHGMSAPMFQSDLKNVPLNDIRGEERAVGLVSESEFRNSAKYFREPLSQSNCVNHYCSFDETVLKDNASSEMTYFLYDSKGVLRRAVTNIFVTEYSNTRSFDAYAETAAGLLTRIYGDNSFSETKDYYLLKSLTLYFLSTYIPANPKIPAVNMYRMPAYYFTLIMSENVLSIIISNERLLEYGVLSPAS